MDINPEIRVPGALCGEYASRSLPLLLLATLATFSLLVTGLAWADVLTYPEAQVLLRERNEALKAADEEVLRSQEEKAVARGLFLPKLETSAQYTRINDPLALELDVDLDGIRQTILGLHPTVPSEAIPSFEKTK